MSVFASTGLGKNAAISFSLMARNGHAGGAVVVFADTTEKHRALDEARQARAQLETTNARLEELQHFRVQLLNNIAHDMGTPLMVLQLRLDGLAEEPSQADGSRIVSRDVFDTLQRATRQLALLTKDVRDVSLMQAGTFRLHMQAVELVPLLRDTLGGLTLLADAAGVRLETVLPEASPRVNADAGRLTQSVHNLVTNAIKFSPPGGKVALRLGADNGTLHIDVQDEGPGIPPELHDRLFRPFSQVHKDTQTKKGTGLGLYIVRGIMRAHGGDALLLPSPRGACFRLTIPEAKA